MSLYMDKLSRMVPVVKNKSQMLTEQGGKVTYAEMEYLPEGNFYEKVPYLNGMENMWDAPDAAGPKRIFLVTDEKNIAIKAAYGYLAYPLYESREAVLQAEEARALSGELRLALCNQDGQAVNLRIVDMTEEKKTEGNVNPYLVSAAGIQENGIAFFLGLQEDADLEQRLDIILTSPAGLQFVQLSEEHLDKPWVRELMMERECDIIRIPRVPNCYYVGILQELLCGERNRLAKDLQAETVVRSIRQKCTDKCREEDFAWALDQAAKKAKAEGRRELIASDFLIDAVEAKGALERLEEMTGLGNMKQAAREFAALSREQERNERLENISKSMLFVGAPGTGKTECGRLIAKIMSEEGQSNGSFLVASRKDIIGKFVGHTAPMISKLFQKARNGVLFVDEAGFFLQDTERGFAPEAIKEFVRHMELYRDVTVIFALYPGEVEDWLSQDAGLASRIGRIVYFEDYTEEELVAIGREMCKERGYVMGEEIEAEISTYMQNRRDSLGEKFGNAREIRKLVEATILEKSVRCFLGKKEERDNVLTKDDFTHAMMRLQKETTKEDKERRIIGFTGGGEKRAEGCC